MHSLHRRLFLGTSLGLAGTASFLMSQESSSKTKEIFPDSFLKKLVPELPAFQPNTIFLTWHKDPTTTMVVQWLGVRGEVADTTVFATNSQHVITPPKREIGAASKTPSPVVEWLSFKPEDKPFPMTDYRVYRAELSGLKPGTEYAFRIGKTSPIYRFRTMPAKATDTITFISGGDCGINQACIDNNRIAARQSPMFAVVGGDLGYDNGKSVETSIAFLRNYSSTMVDPEGRMIPMVPCIGNHEVIGGYGTREKATFFYPLFEGLFPETGFNTLDFGDYLSLVLLDTNHTTKVAGEQTAWLEKTLAARADHPNTLVVNHVPAYPSHRNPLPAVDLKGKTTAGTGEDQRKHWVPLFEKYRVPVVLEHHDHTFKRTKPLINGMENQNGVLYLGDGSWGRIRIPRKQDTLNVLAKTSDDYHISLHRIEGNQRHHLAMGTTGRVMDSCKTGQRKAGIIPRNG